jgi:L-alanine-DL-glutamate epimerase-like enolase superfamily enzyme
MGGINMAMYDLLGKLLDLPVYRCRAAWSGPARVYAITDCTRPPSRSRRRQAASARLRHGCA